MADQGQITNSSYTRIDCVVSRKRAVSIADEHFVAWPWRNDTQSFVESYKSYDSTYLYGNEWTEMKIPPPAPEDIFRFYHAYQIEAATLNGTTVSKNVERSALCVAALSSFSDSCGAAVPFDGSHCVEISSHSHHANTPVPEAAYPFLCA
jgi:hypothetical protein